MNITKQKLKELKKQANPLKNTFNIGKTGITTNFIKQINEYFKTHEIIKIKILNVEEKSQTLESAKIVSQKTNSIIVEVKGFTFTIYREFQTK